MTRAQTWGRSVPREDGRNPVWHDALHGRLAAAKRNSDEGDESFLVLVNAHHEALTWRLPGEAPGTQWETLVDTAAKEGPGPREVHEAGARLPLAARSFVVLVDRGPGRPADD